MTLPPVSSSILNAFNEGFKTLNKAAVQLTSTTDLQDTVELSPESLNAASDPMLDGIMNLSKSKLQIGAAAMLMRAYGAQQKQLLSLFNEAGSDHPSAAHDL
jgi:hypothetical protein